MNEQTYDLQKLRAEKRGLRMTDFARDVPGQIWCYATNESQEGVVWCGVGEECGEQRESRRRRRNIEWVGIVIVGICSACIEPQRLALPVTFGPKSPCHDRAEHDLLIHRRDARRGARFPNNTSEVVKRCGQSVAIQTSRVHIGPGVEKAQRQSSV